MGVFHLSQQGSTQQVDIYPNSDSGCTVQLTPSAGVSHYQCVDEKSTDDDSSYVYTSSVTTLTDVYGVESCGTLEGRITRIKINARAKGQTYTPSKDAVFKILFGENSSCTLYKSVNKELTTNYQSYSYVLSTNPSTGTSWKWDDLNHINIGIECSSPTVLAKPNTMVLSTNGIKDGASFNEVRNYTLHAYSWNETNCPCGDWVGDFGTVAEKNGTFDFYLNPTTAPDGEIQEITFQTFWWSEAQCALNDPLNDPKDCDYRLCGGDGDCRYCTNEHPLGRMGVGNPYAPSWEQWHDVPGDLYYCPCRETITASITLTRAELIGLQGRCDWDDISCYEVYVKALPFYDTHWFGTSHWIGDPKTRMLIKYLSDANPEIRTTQMSATVYYISNESTCTLTSPMEISCNHTRNINMINFWNGDREVYDINRSGKSMVLKGMEYAYDNQHTSTPCERITCIKEMAKNGAIISLDDLGDLYDGDYRIRSFGWKCKSLKPACYEWILELESAEL